MEASRHQTEGADLALGCLHCHSCTVGKPAVAFTFHCNTCFFFTEDGITSQNIDYMIYYVLTVIRTPTLIRKKTASSKPGASLVTPLIPRPAHPLLKRDSRSQCPGKGLSPRKGRGTSRTLSSHRRTAQQVLPWARRQPRLHHRHGRTPPPDRGRPGGDRARAGCPTPSTETRTSAPHRLPAAQEPRDAPALPLPPRPARRRQRASRKVPFGTAR